MTFISQEWLEPSPVELSTEFINTIGGPCIISETLQRRGADTIEKARQFLDPTLYHPSPASDLPDLERAASRLEDAIHNNELIGVWGDFDVDGQTSTAVLVDTLRHLGAHVCYYIPNRSSESHGINLRALKSFLKQGVQVLLTCDTGINDHESVAYAQSERVDVLITDHHALPLNLPLAYAVINPLRLPVTHPLSVLCGVGTAYKLSEELLSHQGDTEHSLAQADLVALGTVADVASLTQDNRFLVQKGLQIFRENCRPGLKTLLEQADVDFSHLSEEHLAFILAPRLNALGRLGDANPMVDFLLSKDLENIRVTAVLLENLNNQRKLIVNQVLKAAQAQIKKDPALLDDPILILSHPDWQSGVLGLVASQLSEIHKRPTILLSALPGGIARASARSTPGIDIIAALGSHKELLIKSGGHPMAAGFSILTENIPKLRRTLSKTISTITADKPQTQVTQIDAYLRLGEIDLNLVEQLDCLSPFGRGNPPLTLATRSLEIKNSTPIGSSKEHLQIIVEDPLGTTSKVIWWRGAAYPLPLGRFDMAYTVRASNFKGEKQVQIEWLNARINSDETPANLVSKDIEIVDYRQAENADENLTPLAEDSCLIWQEGDIPANSKSRDRYHLETTRVLAILTVPPGRAELFKALKATQPQQLIVFSHRHFQDNPKTFLTRLAGIIRHRIKTYQGWVNIQELAAATTQREITISKGIAWLTAKGFISQAAIIENNVQLIENGVENPVLVKQIEVDLQDLLQETSAFRDYFIKASLDWFKDMVNNLADK